MEFMNSLRSEGFPKDELLGDTTWNIGLLHSDNPQNILSPRLDCRLYFRTTFASDTAVSDYMLRCASDCLKVSARGGDSPLRYYIIPGIPPRPYRSEVMRRILPTSSIR